MTTTHPFIDVVTRLALNVLTPEDKRLLTDLLVDFLDDENTSKHLTLAQQGIETDDLVQAMDGTYRANLSSQATTILNAFPSTK